MVKWESEEAELGVFFRLKVGSFRGIHNFNTNCCSELTALLAAA